jgi:hypothetical protein
MYLYSYKSPPNISELAAGSTSEHFEVSLDNVDWGKSEEYSEVVIERG